MLRCFHLKLRWKCGGRVDGFCIPAAHKAWQSGLLLGLILLHLSLAGHLLQFCSPGDRLSSFSGFIANTSFFFLGKSAF